jgi:hypothetical protein
MDHDGQHLEITSVSNRVVKLDLSRNLKVLDPITMASHFVRAYGAPQKVACKQYEKSAGEYTRLTQCGKAQTYVQLDYQWGEAGSAAEVELRIRLRASTPGFGQAHSRVTLSRGWDYRVPRIEACAMTMKRHLDSLVSEAPREDIPTSLRRTDIWWDPDMDSGWVFFYVYETTYYWTD